MSNYRHTWDAKSDQDLLIAMYEVFSPSAEQIRQIVQRTTSMGYSVTCKAVSQHLQKLRRTTTGESGSASAPSTPKTPRTPKTSRAKATAKSGGKRKNNAKAEEGEDAQSDEANAVKKVKTGEANDLAVKNELTSEMDEDSGCI
ncbi:hypothetical protein SEUCBS139899_000376 [Sporothrix eucalyptigena]|uniref:Clr5 domain-containing protein n=1 Tax=Sporothrix eucalyptigena TaxID=1812306 RepID=A0ABP0BDC1_9PEZI